MLIGDYVSMPDTCWFVISVIIFSLSLTKIWEMLIGASGALIKDTKKGNYIVNIALKTV